MTNDQIESAATDHASKYPEHLKTDIVLHYGLGIVRGLKEGSSGEGTIYVPTPISQNPEKEGVYKPMFADGLFADKLYYFDGNTWVYAVYHNKYTHWLRPTTLPQELAAKDKEIEKRAHEYLDLEMELRRVKIDSLNVIERTTKEIDRLTKMIDELRRSRPF